MQRIDSCNVLSAVFMVSTAITLADPWLSGPHQYVSSGTLCGVRATCSQPTRAAADAVHLLQAVASAHKALGSALAGVKLTGDEEQQLTARLKAAADKKVADLLQVRMFLTGLWYMRPTSTCIATLVLLLSLSGWLEQLFTILC